MDADHQPDEGAGFAGLAPCPYRRSQSPNEGWLLDACAINPGVVARRLSHFYKPIFEASASPPLLHSTTASQAARPLAQKSDSTSREIPRYKHPMIRNAATVSFWFSYPLPAEATARLI
jgi:hypothetical protein